MSKKAIYLAVLGLLAATAGVGYVLADEGPADIKLVQAPKPNAPSPGAAPAPTPGAQDRAHTEGMKHGAEEMHGEMMQDHQMGMQNMPQQGMNGMAPQGSQAAMPMDPGKDCCAGKGMKPAAKPMPMPSADKPMPMKDM
jgi:hypothetical protein